MTPKSEPRELAERIQTHAQEQKLVEARRGFTNLEDIERILFGNPTTPEGSFVRQAWERLQEKKGYTLEKQRLMLTMRQTADKIFEAMRKRMEAQGATQKETKEKLEALDGYLRTVGVLGQVLKVQNSPYGVSGEAGVQSTRDIMETEELAVLSRVAEYLQSLNIEELIDMILEDQAYITMLVELHDVEGSDKAILDFLPEEFDLIDIDRVGGRRIGKLDHQNPKYRHNLKHLRSFILGKPEEGGKKRSNERRMTETPLWIGIVRSMDFRQKRDIVATFFTEGTAKEAEDFITACIVGGVMSKEEVIHMMDEAEHDAESPFKKLPKDFEKKVDAALASRARVQKQMKSVVAQTENVYIQNAANHFITFNNLVMGRVAELGVLTAGLNFVLDVVDRFRRRTEPGRNEGRLESIAKGVGDALKNPWFYVGVGEMAVGSNYVYPWIRSAILSPSKEEKGKLAEHKEMKFLREQVQNHPELDEYFLQHYDEYLDIARRNEGEKGKFALYPGDIKVTPEEAGKVGYPDAETATAVMVRMFMICAGEFRQPSSEKLAKFFADNIYSHQESHGHA